ncbi:23S rRNA (guanosine(2251)-2'-O)-methyltransferase RlmB [Pectinatus haikarae]|nr:23S rRNA (guanosine(2251)-2'-O)-methyltransferase RlmB [Pectinatus haikarae]
MPFNKKNSSSIKKKSTGSAESFGRRKNTKTKDREERKFTGRTAKFRDAQKTAEASEQTQEISPDIIAGRNAVREALKSGRHINKILTAENAHGGSMQEIISMARNSRVIIHTVSQNKLDALSGAEHNQGIIAYTPPVDYAELDDVLAGIAEKNEVPFLVLLDELEDPHNLGAVLRTADAAGAHGVIISKRRSCPLSSTVAKVSAGAIEYVPVVRVNNIAQTIAELKTKGFWVAGADASGETFFYDANLTGPLLIVVGSEGKGIGQLVRQSCDFLVKIPMRGKINSLNASNAAAILMYEVLKQRMK